MAEKINIEGREISIKQVNEQEYISLTDIARYRDSPPNDTIRNWLNNGSTLRYLEAWELKKNPNFKQAQMDLFRITLADGRDKIRIQEFINLTNALGVISKSGRYGVRRIKAKDPESGSTMVILSNTMRTYNRTLLTYGC